MQSSTKSYIGHTVHCYKTLRRIPPPWPDGAGPNGQGRGKWLPYIVREFTALGTEVFHDQPKFSIITGNFQRFFLRKKRECAQSRIELRISRIPIRSSTPRLQPHYIKQQNVQYLIKMKRKSRKNKELKINKKNKH